MGASAALSRALLLGSSFNYLTFNPFNDLNHVTMQPFQYILRLSTMTHLRTRQNVLGFVTPSPVGVAIE